MKKTIKVSLQKSMVESLLRDTSDANVLISGVNAWGTTTVEGGTLKTATVQGPGNHYTSAPTVTIVTGAGGGSLGTVTATISPFGWVSAFTILGTGVDYTGAPGLTCSGGNTSPSDPAVELGD
jgi:hypothetical protein